MLFTLVKLIVNIEKLTESFKKRKQNLATFFEESKKLATFLKINIKYDHNYVIKSFIIYYTTSLKSVQNKCAFFIFYFKIYIIFCM